MLRIVPSLCWIIKIEVVFLEPDLGDWASQIKGMFLGGHVCYHLIQSYKKNEALTRPLRFLLTDCFSCSLGIHFWLPFSSNFLDLKIVQWASRKGKRGKDLLNAENYTGWCGQVNTGLNNAILAAF